MLARSRGSDKTFALSRFGKVAPTGKHFKRPARFDWRAFSREAFGIANGEKPERIRLLFSAHVATYIRERVWHPSQILRERRDGSLEMRIETSGHKELVRCVLSWVPDVEVMAPRSLRDRVQQKLREALGSSAIATSPPRSRNTASITIEADRQTPGMVESGRDELRKPVPLDATISPERASRY